MLNHQPTNIQIAAVLDALAERLAARDGVNPFRVRAYRAAADTLRDHPESIAERYAEGGLDALTLLPNVGQSLALHVARYLETGRLTGRLPAEALDPVSLLASVPSVSRPLARRLVHEHGIETLTDLERACYDGRLRAVHGIGPVRLRALRMQLNTLVQWATLERYERLRAMRRPTADQYRLAA